MTTFITFIGKGTPIRSEDAQRTEYTKTEYLFDDGRLISKSCSANAVLASGTYSFTRLCVIGTTGSTWSQLLEDPVQDTPEENLYLELLENEREINATPDNTDFQARQIELLSQLKQTLTERWNVKETTCLIVPSVLEGNKESILTCYLDAALKAEGDVVLDITHALRWMPQLLTSVLQLADALSSERNMKILYGEFGKTSQIRELKGLWDTRQLVTAVKLFFDKWEGGPLADRMEECWPTGAKALRALSSHLQGNFVVPLVLNEQTANGPGKPLSQLRNALEDLRNKPNQESIPLWLRTTAQRLEELRKRLTKPTTASGRLKELAKLYAEKQMYGLAVICQECALRMYCLERQGMNHYPTWDDLVAATDWARNNVFNHNERDDFKAILNHRNAVAHGALRPRNDRGIPQVSNLPSQFESQQSFLERLI